MLGFDKNSKLQATRRFNRAFLAILTTQTALAALVILSNNTAAGAQENGASTPLPAVTVEAPAQKKKRPTATRQTTRRVEAKSTQRPVKRRATRTTAPSRVATRAPVAPPVAPAPTPSQVAAPSGTGPINGYVPRVSATGTKTATPLIETPQSISVIGAEQISDLNATSLVQATRYTSGVVSQTFGDDNRNDFLLIRGLPAQQTGYFLDGLQLASPGFATFRIEPFNLERIEVLKGPASVLYGGANAGGIVNVVSKRPTDTQHGDLEFGINNYGNTYGRFDLGGPVVGTGNQWFYRVEGLARFGDTQTNFTPDDRLSIAPSLTFQPDAATTFTVLGSYQKDRTRGQNFLPYVGTVQPGPFGRISTSLFTSDPSYDTFQRNQALIGYEAEHKFSDAFTVRQNLRYSDLRINDRTLFGLGYANSNDPTTGELLRSNFNTVPHLSELAVDTQVETHLHTGALSHVALFGIDYKHFNFLDAEGFTTGSDFNLLQPNYTGALAPPTNGILNLNKQDQLGEYLQDQIKFNRFTLVLSGRHDGVTASLDNQVTPSASRTTTRDAFTGRVGLIYTSDSGVAPYATYATSFDPQIGTAGSGDLLKPLTGQLTEVGFKYQPIGTRLSFTGALFNLVEQNVSSATADNPFSVIQTGEERSRGYELEVQGQITDGLKVVGSVTGYQLRDTSDLNPAFVGKVPVNVPQSLASLFLDYTIQTTQLRGLGAGAGFRYLGGSYASQDNTFYVPAYTLADFTVHYEREHWRAAFNMTNAFDRTYVSGCSSTTACFYGERAKATFSLAYKW